MNKGLPTLLVVEDNPTTSKLFRVALEVEGYRVLEAADGRRALALATLDPPDLVLMDLVLPDIEGLDLARRFRDLPSGLSLPIVAVSGFRRLLDRAVLEPGAFNEVLLKPVDLEQLRDVVSHFVAQPGPPRRESAAPAPTVLVLDDDPVQLKLTSVRLELEGFKVLTATDGSGGLALMRETPPDAVLCDVLMPGRDGYEVCLAIRSEPTLAHVPVVLVSAHFGGVRDEELAKQVGASGFVMRTPDIQGIAEALRRALAAGAGPTLRADFPRAEHAERVNAQLKRQARANAGWAERSALQTAQLTILAGIGNALARSENVEAAFGDVLATCLDTGGISRGALYRFDAREEIVCTHSLGFPDGARDALGTAFGHRQLLERARSGGVVAPSSALSAAETRQFLASAGATAAVLVPLLGDRTCNGALLLASASDEMGEQDLLAFGRAIATHVSQALGMASSVARLQAASDASRLLSASLDLRETLNVFGKLATDELADVCEVHLAGEDSVVYAVPGSADAAAHGHRPSHAIVSTLLAHERALGTVTLGRRPGRRPFDDMDRLFAEDLIQRAALAVDNARLYRTAQEASRLKDEFLATLSHELRTPLNAILGWARMLSAGLDEEHRVNAIRVIERNALAQARLIEDLLDTASMVSNRARLDLRLIDMAKIAESAIDSVRPAAESKRHTLRYDAVGSVLIFADAGRLQQMITNLLNNALKFTPDGGVISIVLKSEGGQAVLRVSDNGKGIEPGFLPQIFERFKQADGSFTRAHGGLGLGLAITRQLAELHHGSVEAHSEGLGRGATFTLRLPRADVQTGHGSDPLASQPLTIRDEGELRDLNILVVDDEPDSRELTVAVLERHGARAICASSCDEALGAFVRSPPDVLLSDIGMPGEDGISLIQKVRALPAANGGAVPAIALSGYAAAKDRSVAISAGYTHHMSKPFEPSKLVAIIAGLPRASKSPRLE